MTEPQQSPAPPQPITVQAKIILPAANELPPAEAANFFRFSWGGTDVQLLVGYLDMSPVEARPGEVAEVMPQINHRLFMSVQGFALLRAQLLEAADGLIKSGVPLDQLNPLRRVP